MGDHTKAVALPLHSASSISLLPKLCAPNSRTASIRPNPFPIFDGIESSREELSRNGRHRYVSCRAQRGRSPPAHQAKELGGQGTRCHSRVLYRRCRRYPIDWSVHSEEDGRPQSREAVKIPRRRLNEVGLVTKDETEAEPDIVNEWTLEHTDAGSCKKR